jgi:hypothetical protein
MYVVDIGGHSVLAVDIGRTGDSIKFFLNP